MVGYFVIAQDTAATPNIGSNPSGAVATDVNNVTTPPGAPATYTILPGISGGKTSARVRLPSLTNAGGSSRRSTTAP